MAADPRLAVTDVIAHVRGLGHSCQTTTIMTESDSARTTVEEYSRMAPRYFSAIAKMATRSRFRYPFQGEKRNVVSTKRK